MQILIIDPYLGQLHITPSEWADASNNKFNMKDRIDSIQGEAFDFMEWFDGWRSNHNTTLPSYPSHLRVTAMDEFTALIPWSQLRQAAIQYTNHDEPLTKGYPIRLYVPNGTSDCLNVKSVVKFEMLYDIALGEEASFGFINQIKLEDMFVGKGE